jgi:RHS repeat-associated protein
MLVFAAAELLAETTVYVGKHFEVREHDQPTKYVFNGGTRVARITGSLSTNTRIQRLRLRAGWNLVSLAVTAPYFLDQLRDFTDGPAPVIQALYRWQPATRDFEEVAPGAGLMAGTVLWISARTNAVVAVRGGYVEPGQWGALSGGTFVATPALEAQSLTVPPGVRIWRYDARIRRWQAGLTGDLASLSDLPPTLAPGEAIYVHSTEPTDLGMPAREERLRYYHQDHLGSSSVMTDAEGALVEETAFYPFGIPRHGHRLRQMKEAYKFTQKERDRESGLHYFETRYLAGTMSRFLSVDPKYANNESSAGDPQSMNLYAYVHNNPLRCVDPTGLDDESPWWDPLGITGVSDSDSANYGMGVLDASGAVPFWGFMREEIIEANPGVINGDSTAYKAGDWTGTAVGTVVTMFMPFPVKAPPEAPGTVTLFAKTPAPVASALAPTSASISSRAGTSNPGRIEPDTRIRFGNMKTMDPAYDITRIPVAGGSRPPTQREIHMEDPAKAAIIQRLDANRATLDRLNAEGKTAEASALLGRIFSGQ